LAAGLNVEAIKLLNSIKNTDGTPIFDKDNDADLTFCRELAALTELVPLLRTDAIRSIIKDSHPDLFTFVFSGLQKIQLEHGESSLQYRIAWAKLNGILVQVSDDFANLYENKATVSLLLMDKYEKTPAPLTLNRHARAPTSGVVSLYTCYSTEEECSQATSNCSSKASCTVYKLQEPNICYRCDCGQNYSGEQCQYTDISASFWIIVFIVVTLFVTLILVTSSLAYMDPGTNTLIFRTGQISRQKTD